MAGGTAVVLGSLMPWISFNSAGVEVKPGARAASVVLGLVVVALGFALHAAPLPGRLAAGIATLCLSSLAGLLYVGFILAGLGGVPEQDPFGDMTTVTFSPNIGIILAVAGCAVWPEPAVMAATTANVRLPAVMADRMRNFVGFMADFPSEIE